MLARMLGAATFNRGTFEEVEHDTGATWQAALVVVLVSLSGAIGGALSGNTGLVSGIIVGIVGGVVWWALWAAGCWLVGTKILNTPETRADWGELARGTGFAQTPGLLSVLVFLPYAGGAIAAVIFVWRFVTMLMAVQESLDYNSMWRAFFVVLIALIPVLIVAAIIFAILGSLGIQDSETSTSALLGIFNVIGA
jgi:hypothetical protein